jgi:hypothetical protein
MLFYPWCNITYLHLFFCHLYVLSLKKILPEEIALITWIENPVHSIPMLQIDCPMWVRKSPPPPPWCQSTRTLGRHTCSMTHRKLQNMTSSHHTRLQYVQFMLKKWYLVLNKQLYKNRLLYHFCVLKNSYTSRSF